MNPDTVPHSDGESLAKMLDLESGSARLWAPEELAAILEHQLSSVIQFDLGRLNGPQARRLRVTSAADGLLVNSFLDLFRHPHPPVELLELTKQFAKACKNHPDSPLPPEIADVLYLLSIVVAMTKCRRRITALDPAAVRRGVTWALDQTWLDAQTRGLLEQGLKAIDGEESQP